MKTASLLLVATGALAPFLQDPAKPPAAQAPRETVVVKAAAVKWADHPFVKGAKMCVVAGDPAKGPSTLLMKFPKGMAIAPHWHTADEVVTVVSGSAVFGSGETADASQGTELGTGSYIVIPGKNPHWAIVRDELVINVALDKPADFHECAAHK